MQWAVAGGDEGAFARLYQACREKVRLIAWRVSHRADWIDEIVHDAWCRAFEQRKSYDPSRPFLVWMAGIVQNVYREQCRKSRVTISDLGSRGEEATAELGPQEIAEEAETLSGLNDCLSRLGPEDARIIRLRFFESKTLRLISEELRIAESTLRAQRLPEIMEALRRCMASKGIEISELFPAHGEGPDQ